MGATSGLGNSRRATPLYAGDCTTLERELAGLPALFAGGTTGAGEVPRQDWERLEPPNGHGGRPGATLAGWRAVEDRRCQPGWSGRRTDLARSVTAGERARMHFHVFI